MPNLPYMEEVCAQIQKEEGSLGLFGSKGGLSLANKAEEAAQANRAAYKNDERKYGDDRRFGGNCDHCKKPGHKRSQCWILHPHLKPAKFNKEREARANLSAEASEAGSSGAGTNAQVGESTGRAMATHYAATRSLDHEVIRKSDIDALIKALKESGTFGNTLGYSYTAHTMPRNENRLLDIISELKLRNKSPRTHLARGIKPLIIDSGASHHMISDDSLIKNIEPAQGHVMIANGDRIPIRGIGDLKLFDKNSKAFYMPEFTSNLLSVKRCTNDLQCNVIFSPNDVKFQDIESSKLIGQGVTKGDLYLLEDITPISSCLLSSVLSKGALWHSRLGHPHVRALSLMLPGVMFKNNDCEACILGKHCKTVFKRSTTIYDNCFDLIHSDVWTAPCLSRDNYKYFVTFIDEKSKYTWITLIKTKDRVLDAFKNFQSYVSNQYNAKIKIFRSDNGGEYTGNAFKNHLAQHGILHQTSCPYTPQQNGVAERKNRHLMEVARSMMFHTSVPKRFWSDAVISACYLINRIPTKILEDQAPYEVLNRSKPVLDHLRVFGCVCFVLVPGELRNKLEAKSTRAMFIGYSKSQKGYKCYDSDARRVLVSRDVKFLEDKSFYGDRKWEDLEDLSQPSDKATSLRRVLEGLGINMSQDQQPTSTNEAEESSHLDHEGGNEPEPGDHEDQDSDNHVQGVTLSEEESTQEDQIETNEVEGEGVEPAAVMEPVPVPLRRSTRLKRDTSNWVNTRVYYNAQAVEHPSQAVCSFAEFPQEHCAFMVSLDKNSVPRSYEEAMMHKVNTFVF
ncbi:hypothetical protein YC2023_076203 [Brassica napus]